MYDNLFDFNFHSGADHQRHWENIYNLIKVQMPKVMANKCYMQNQQRAERDDTKEWQVVGVCVCDREEGERQTQ